MKKNNNLLFMILSGLSLLGFVRYIDNSDYWITDFFSNFPFQYALAALTVFIFCLRKKLIALSVLAGLLFVFNMNAVIDFEKSIHAAGNTGTIVKVFSVNIHKDNRELSNLKYELQEIDPDIVLLLEVTPKHEEQLRPLMLTYPYRIENISAGILGVVFLSKFPVHDYHFTKLSAFGNSLLDAMLEINEQSVMFYGIHAPRPDRGDFNERKEQFFKPARQIRNQSLPAIVAGDFNTTPYSPVFKKFVRTAGLRDSREGFGWQPSWPTSFPPFWIPIDHILVTPDFQIRKRTTGSYIGSDHYPVIAELSIN